MAMRADYTKLLWVDLLMIIVAGLLLQDRLDPSAPPEAPAERPQIETRPAAAAADSGTSNSSLAPPVVTHRLAGSLAAVAPVTGEVVVELPPEIFATWQGALSLRFVTTQP